MKAMGGGGGIAIPLRSIAARYGAAATCASLGGRTREVLIPPKTFVRFAKLAVPFG